MARPTPRFTQLPACVLLGVLLCGGPAAAQEAPVQDASAPTTAPAGEPAAAETAAVAAPAAAATESPAATTPCPQLPATAGVSWQDISGPGFLFCKALRDSDGAQVLGVTFNAEPNFRPDSTLKVGDAKMDGHDISWYRARVAGVADTHVRETLLQLGDNLYAHVWLRADDVDAMNAAMQLAEQLRFGNGPTLGQR